METTTQKKRRLEKAKAKRQQKLLDEDTDSKRVRLSKRRARQCYILSTSI